MYADNLSKLGWGVWGYLAHTPTQRNTCHKFATTGLELPRLPLGAHTVHVPKSHVLLVQLIRDSQDLLRQDTQIWHMYVPAPMFWNVDVNVFHPYSSLPGPLRDRRRVYMSSTLAQLILPKEPHSHITWAIHLCSLFRSPPHTSTCGENPS